MLAMFPEAVEASVNLQDIFASRIQDQCVGSVLRSFW